jgi:hypothetical protein
LASSSFDRGSSFAYSLTLTFENPADDLVTVEDQSAARPRPEVRQSSGNMPLQDGPGRAANELRDFTNAKRFAEFFGRFHRAFSFSSPVSASGSGALGGFK